MKPAAQQIVGVIFTHADFQRAAHLRNPPDLFELRLDTLFPRVVEIEASLGDLPAPLIITARHPREGGSNQLSARKRRALLLRFLPYAAYLDVELRSAGTFGALLADARRKRIRTIASFHDFDETPSRSRLDRIAGAARSLGADLLKIATRTDNAAQLARLRDFFQHKREEMEIAVMGVGRLGRTSRLEFARHGSALNYAHLGRPRAAGQPSIAQLRRALRKNPVPPSS